MTGIKMFRPPFYFHSRAVVPSSERAGGPPPGTSRRAEGDLLGQARVRDEVGPSFALCNPPGAEISRIFPPHPDLLAHILNRDEGVARCGRRVEIASFYFYDLHVGRTAVRAVTARNRKPYTAPRPRAQSDFQTAEGYDEDDAHAAHTHAA